MKLLMITGLGSAKDLASGHHGAFYNTLEEFHQYWDRIDIICPKVIHIQGRTLYESYPLQGWTLQKFSNVFLHISPYDGSTLLSKLKHFRWFLKKGQKLFQGNGFDLMTVQEFPPFYNGILARLLWKKILVLYVLEIHHIPGYPKASGLKELIYRYLWKIGLFIKWDFEKAAAVRVVNQNQVPDFLKKAGVLGEKIKYIPSLYLDLDVFRPLNLKKEFDLIFVGRLVENKGIKLLLQATAKLKAQNEKLKILVVGEGPLRKEIEKQITNYQLPITMHGWAKDAQEVAKLINQSKILIMPSYNEGGPRVVGEAMACGVPVLATSVGVVPDLIKPGISGEIIGWQAEDIAEKASALLADQEKYDLYSQAGMEIAKNFERKTMIKNYAEQLKAVIEQTSNTPT